MKKANRPIFLISHMINKANSPYVFFQRLHYLTIPLKTGPVFREQSIPGRSNSTPMKSSLRACRCDFHVL